jgi:hypothetical protein
MKRHHACWLLPATLLWATATAWAQDSRPTHPPKPAADPLDATSPVAPLVYRSTFASYRRLSEPEPMAWREAIDQVGRIGGWRAYAREANAPEPSPAPATKPAPSPDPATGTSPSSPSIKDPHGGHHGNGVKQ